MATDKTQHNSAKHAFFYLTSFFALALAATAVGSLAYQIINHFLPQEGLGFSGASQGIIKFGISSLIVAAPVFYFTTRVINRSLSRKDLDLDSGIRRWLTYIIMFIAAATVIGDLVTVVYHFLDGEYSLRFFLKAGVILLIAGSIFLYYFSDMKNESQEKRNKKSNLWSVVFWILTIVPLVWALTVMESPRVTREKKIDSETVNYLQNIRWAVEEYAREEGQIPDSIDQIQAKNPDRINGLETLQERGFSYRLLDDREYELCAEFRRDNRDQGDTQYNYYDSEWLHPQGNYCFTLTVSRNDILSPKRPTINVES